MDLYIGALDDGYPCWYGARNRRLCSAPVGVQLFVVCSCCQQLVRHWHGDIVPYLDGLAVCSSAEILWSTSVLTNTLRHCVEGRSGACRYSVTLRVFMSPFWISGEVVAVPWALDFCHHLSIPDDFRWFRQGGKFWPVEMHQLLRSTEFAVSCDLGMFRMWCTPIYSLIARANGSLDLISCRWNLTR